MYKVKAYKFLFGELELEVDIKDNMSKSEALSFAREYARTQAKIIGINEVNDTEDGAEYSYYEHVFDGSAEIRFFVHWIYRVIKIK